MVIVLMQVLDDDDDDDDDHDDHDVFTWKGEGDSVCGVGQKNGGVGFRPGQAERGNGENSKLRGF